ncbi:serine hydrolase domain-containing protein [Schleiferia thermophila]|uniref:serine hydrolase domain-containing protein n=1 Tax=Schleiferia thermophila TaxID=884107 RepID=UPI001268FD3F|nr:serine hydrolase domain-containing protein [Schleiferia thermophila]
MMSKIFILLAFMSLLFPGFGQTTDSLKKYVEHLTIHNSFSGQIAIVQGGRLLFSTTAGFRDVESKKPISMDDVFRIGSISKTYTAALIFKLIEKGKLNAKTTLDNFFPEVANSKRITIEMMLRHRSGIRSYTEQMDYPEYHTQLKNSEQIVKKIETFPPEFDPGAQYKYSNSNYLLLALIAEKVMKKSYCELLTELIFRSNKLKNTFCDDLCIRRVIPSFYHIGDSIIPSTITASSVAKGAGNICANASDVALFYQRLFDGKIIKPTSLSDMVTFENNVGAGIFQVPFYNRKGYGHGGKIDAFRSYAIYFPDDGLSLAIVSNVENDFDLNDILIGLLSIWYGIPYSFPEFQTVNFSASDAEYYIGEYTSNEIPLSIDIFLKNQQIYAQATGQAAFPLKMEDVEKFSFKQAGIVLEFKDLRDGKYQGFILRQGGYTFHFIRK